MFPETRRPVPDGVRALDYFSQRLRQHVFVEREIGDQPFQPVVFFFELSEPAQFAHTEVRVLFLPHIEGRFTDAQLSADIADRRPASPCRRAYAICSSENLVCFIGPLLSRGTAEAVILL